MVPQVANGQFQLGIVNIKCSEMVLSHYMYRHGHSHKTTNMSIPVTIQYNRKAKCNAICTCYA